MDKDKVTWSDYIWHIGNIQLVEAWTLEESLGDTFSLRRIIMVTASNCRPTTET